MTDGSSQHRPSAEVLAALQRIEERLERLERSSERARELGEALPGALATIVDSVDERIARLSARGVDVDERLSTLLRVVERLTAPEALEVLCSLLTHVDILSRLLDSGVFSPGAVDAVGRAADALSSLDMDRVEPVGSFGALRALGDPDVKQALGVLLAFGKCFGKSAHRTR